MALADFLAEFSGFPDQSELPEVETWVAYVDGSSTRKGSSADVMLISPERESFEFAIRLAITTMNNEAEYEVVKAGIGIARDMGAKNLEVRSDSQVVVEHI